MKLFQRKENLQPEPASPSIPRPAAPSILKPAERRLMGYRTAVLQGQGERNRQEDSWLLMNDRDVTEIQRVGLLAVVADGMGGMADGKLASETAVNSFCDDFNMAPNPEQPRRWLYDSVRRADEQVYQRLGGSGGSTLVGCILYQEKLWFLSVGDSYLYLFRDGELNRLNRLHTVRNREYLREIESKQPDFMAARNCEEAEAVTSFLGRGSLKEIDSFRRPLALREDDILLLCSDGVAGTLDEEELRYCLNQGIPKEIGEALEQRVLAKQKMYQDNYTALIIQCTY